MKELCFMDTDHLTSTLIGLIRIPSTSGHEEKIRDHLIQYLASFGLPTSIDRSGNLISTMTGQGSPLLLNAHMDRVPPGLGHQPILRNGLLFSDGTTNLGADDAAGIAVILEVVRRTKEQDLPHPPLVLVFTVQEESGMCGASNFDSTMWNVTDGIVFDNAFEAGVVVSKGAAYEAFDIQITGRTGHPGKDLAQTVDAIEIFRSAHYPHGSFDGDQTRINIGKVIGGSARNAIPDTVLVEGELRSFESLEVREKYKQAIQDAFEQAARVLGGQVKLSFKTHSNGYELDPTEPLLKTYSSALEKRGATMQMKPTFIGSDTSGLRPTIRVFTISTGVVHEHSTEENVAIEPLEQLVMDTLQVLDLWSKR